MVSLDDLAGVVRDGIPDRAAVVVSQGHYDEQALEVLLKASVPYVGLVASRKRGRDRPERARGERRARRRGLRSPAGLDLGARTAPEVALSILAEIVQAQTGQAREETAVPAPAAATNAVDPICGMSVDVASARHTAEVDGIAYYFCCANCRAKFLKDPQAYLAHP